MKLPVILVTGFLGSGKTTLLRHLAGAHPELRLVFLVNELASTGFDGESVARTGRPAHSVVGGSLFCECKAAEFVRTMSETVLEAHKEQPLDAVIIETSGIADPAAIGSLMTDHGLTEHFSISRILTIVAPPRFASLVKNLEVITAQIQTSDVVILNKCDLATHEQIAFAEEAIRSLNPRAEILQTSYCVVEMELFLGRDGPLPAEPLATCEANPFTTATLPFNGVYSLADVRSWVSQLPDTVLRAKGIVRTDEGWIAVEKTVDSCTFEIISSHGSEPGIVLIVHDEFEGQLEKLVQSFDLRALSVA